MALHGVIAIVLGLLAGFPYAQVIAGAMAGEERAWRMAHLEGVLNGLLVLGVAGVAPGFALSRRQHALLAWSLVGAGYANVVASVIGAWTGQRGLALADSPANNLVFVLFVAAIVAVFVGLAFAALGALRARSASSAAPGRDH
jgi:uncharacterized membrane protein